MADAWRYEHCYSDKDAYYDCVEDLDLASLRDIIGDLDSAMAQVISRCDGLMFDRIVANLEEYPPCPPPSPLPSPPTSPPPEFELVSYDPWDNTHLWVVLPAAVFAAAVVFDDMTPVVLFEDFEARRNAGKAAAKAARKAAKKRLQLM
jgi:hypothetical protein